MNFNIIFFLNLLSLFGVIFLLIGHFYISNENKIGFLISSLGSSLVAISSYFLESYPVVFLNIVWFFISIYGFLNYNHSKSYNFIKIKKIYFNFFIFFSIIFCLFFYNIFDLAWITTIIYITFYFLLSIKKITIHYYLFICIIGFLISIPHLIYYQSYSVLLNEFIAASISFYNLFNQYSKKYTLKDIFI